MPSPLRVLGLSVELGEQESRDRTASIAIDGLPGFCEKLSRKQDLTVFQVNDRDSDPIVG